MIIHILQFSAKLVALMGVNAGVEMKRRVGFKMMLWGWGWG